MKIVFWFDYIEEDGPVNNGVRWNGMFAVPESSRDESWHEQWAKLENSQNLGAGGTFATREIEFPTMVQDMINGQGAIVEFKKISPDAYVDPNASYHFYWIDLVGESAWVIANNLFSNIPVPSLQFLIDQQITLVINNSKESDDLVSSGSWNFGHTSSYTLPMIRGQMQLYGLDDLDTILLINGDSNLADRWNEQWNADGVTGRTLRAVVFDYFYFQSLWQARVAADAGQSSLPTILPRDRFKDIPEKPIFAPLGGARPHRIMIYQEMVNSGLIPRSNASLFPNGITDTCEDRFDWIETYNNQCVRPEMKITIDLGPDANYTFDVPDHQEVYDTNRVFVLDPDIMHSTVIHIVGESWWHAGGLSEKVMKCFAWGHIPLFFGGPGLIAHLSERFGFKFIPEFSYRYDNRFHSPQERVNLFREEIRKLKNYTNEDLRDLYIKNLDIIEHNQQVANGGNFKRELATEFNNMINERTRAFHTAHDSSKVRHWSLDTELDSIFNGTTE
jgi:hypothetical protein